VSCGTCHDPSLAWGDGLARGIGEGMKRLGRRSPTILNVAWASTLFWDGRAHSLEEQALEALQLPWVMNMPAEALVERVTNIRSYPPDFNAAFPGAGITPHTIAMAIGTFERTVVSGLSPFDRWNLGDERAVPESAKRGFQTFVNKGGCAECHGGWRFTDDSFHDIGLPGTDLGRGKLLPQQGEMQHAFKTPTLRNVALRAPYMHNGSRATLAEVVEHYNQGGAVKRPSLSGAVKPLRLTAVEKQDLVNFLQTLTSEY
jgi:cytochrome c peroxidase